MYIENLRQEFYNVILGKRTVLIVNLDIDAICACKILQSLLKGDNILYTTVPVRGIDDLKQAYRENCEDVSYFIFINCGGTIDLIDTLEPEENIIFFVLDSHRPTDVCNVYSTGQIRILSPAGEDEGLPDFDSIFHESDEESQNSGSESEGDDESRASKRRRLNEEDILKRREKRQWEEQRNKLMFDYTQFSYYGRSSAMVIYELVWKLGKENKELLWCAIVGVTEQIVLNKVENQQYVMESEKLQSHVARLCRGMTNEQIHSTLKITFDKDLRLALYRHWTVESSIRHSMYSACKLKLWTLRGEKRLHELLAEMGLPLAQSRQNFNAMDLVLRKEFQETLEKFSEKYGLDNIVYASFTLQCGYRFRFCASDVVYAMLAVMETTMKEKKYEDSFLDALDCLSKINKDILETGVEKAKKILTTIFKQVQSSLDMKQVKSAGPFLYLMLNEGSAESNIFSHPHCLSLLAQFALRAYVAVSRNKKASRLPLICSAPLDTQEGTCLMIGVAPVSEDSAKNFFGKAFEQAAENSRSAVSLDYSDSSVRSKPMSKGAKISSLYKSIRPTDIKIKNIYKF